MGSSPQALHGCYGKFSVVYGDGTQVPRSVGLRSPFWGAVNLEPPCARQDLGRSSHTSLYLPFIAKARDFAPIGPKAEAGLPPSTGRALEQEAEAPPKRRTSSFCADRERHWARFLSLRPTVSSIFCEARSWWLSVGALRNTSRHVDTLSVRVIEFNGWAQAHPDTTRTPSVH